MLQHNLTNYLTYILHTSIVSASESALLYGAKHRKGIIVVLTAPRQTSADRPRGSLWDWQPAVLCWCSGQQHLLGMGFRIWPHTSPRLSGHPLTPERAPVFLEVRQGCERMCLNSRVLALLWGRSSVWICTVVLPVLLRGHLKPGTEITRTKPSAVDHTPPDPPLCSCLS